jgi:hypothetical protein
MEKSAKVKTRKRSPGAGRKPLGKQKFTFTLKPETSALIDKRVADTPITRNQYVEEAVLCKLEIDAKLSGQGPLQYYEPCPFHPGKGMLHRFNFVNLQGGSLATALALLCASCAVQKVQSDPFQRFYRPTPYAHSARVTYSKVAPPVWVRPITAREDAKRAASMLIQQGYIPIGISEFRSNWEKPHREAAGEMGRKIGASLVIYVVQPIGAGQYSHTVAYLAKER